MKKASLLPFCFLISLLSRYLCETFLKKSTYPLSSYLQKLEGRLDVEIPNLQVTFAPSNISYSIVMEGLQKIHLCVLEHLYQEIEFVYKTKISRKNQT